jgi:hypothetical protein
MFDNGVVMNWKDCKAIEAALTYVERVNNVGT